MVMVTNINKICFYFILGFYIIIIKTEFTEQQVSTNKTNLMLLINLTERTTFSAVVMISVKS